MIKEFDLDAPMASKENRNRFRLETRCVSGLFERFFISPKETGKVWKILIEVVPVINKLHLRDLLGVLTIQVEGDIDTYFNLTQLEKKRQTLAWLWKGINKISDQKKWEIDVFEEARKSVEKVDYNNSWSWKNPIKHRNRNLFAQIYVEHDVEEARIFVRFTEASGLEKGKVLLVSAAPSEFIFNKYFGKFEWEGDAAKLSSRKGDEFWMASLE